MRYDFNLVELQPVKSIYGSRASAFKLRERLEILLESNKNFNEVSVDFGNQNATQSFVDELIGVLILKYSPNIIKKLIFKGCNQNTKSVIQFVIVDRSNQANRNIY